MTKFHINSKGDVKPCKATVNACQFGGDDLHFKDDSEARVFVEKILSNENGINALLGKKKSRDEITLKLQNTSEKNPTDETVKLKANSEKKFFAATPLEVNKKGYLTKEAAQLVSTKGVTCGKCGADVSTAAMLKMLMQQDASCSTCKTLMELSPKKSIRPSEIFPVNIKIDEDNYSYKFYDKAEVYKETWSHASVSDDWENEIGKNFEAHVGTEQASFDRAINTLDINRRSGGNIEPGFYMYKVKIKENAVITDTVAEDENSQAILDDEHHVSRYINRWEDISSISLAIKSEMIDVVHKEWIPAKVAFTYPTIYNLDYN